ncbi:acyltransferase [Caulobacter sp. RHG1]|uniref:acyltransferase family protein n=1 Tax=Caulobacter sp. (strain RHG1) TaxID=2545762 RepID=UPI001554D46D|nr:acyltransferase [Caulobacter sp. RHG1]NQE60960.1 Acyltransferase [Caulobacter sp. RHG1]
MRLPPLKPDSDQMLHLDALRIVGAVMIVVFHFNRFINLDGRWQLADDTIKSFSLIVDLFFLISGYVMAAIYTGRLTTFAKYRDFLQKRVARLGPLHWATMLVFVVIAALGWAGLINERDASRYDVTCIPQNVLFIHAWGTCKAQTWNFASWAISAEMGLYLALPLLFKITALGRWPTAAVAFGSLAVLLWISRDGETFSQWTFNFGVARAVPGFMLGMLAFQMKDVLAKIPQARFVMWALLAAFVIASGLGASRTSLLLVIYAVGLAAVAADAAGVQGGISRALAPWAQLSFSLYLLHPIALKIALNWVGFGMWHLNGDAMRLWCLVWVIALFPIAYLSLIGFERPARDWIAKLGRKA